MSIEEARAYARELTEKAKASLEIFSGTDDHKLLCELADYLLTREK